MLAVSAQLPAAALRPSALELVASAASVRTAQVAEASDPMLIDGPPLLDFDERGETTS
jgi:hypothetical protein